MNSSSILHKVGPAPDGTTAILSDRQWKNAFKQPLFLTITLGEAKGISRCGA